MAMNQNCSFIPLSHLRYVVAIAAFLLLIPSDALKHNYYTKRDDRSLIGPIGYPFGFLDSGRYRLTVFDFQLTPTKKSHKHDSHSNTRLLTSAFRSEILKNIKGVGFLLKQFEDESSFNRYMDYIEEEPNSCIFEKYLEMKENDDIYGEDSQGDAEYKLDLDDEYLDDEFVMNYDFDLNNRSRRQQRKRELNRKNEEIEGFGEVLDAVEDGIYLDMMPQNTWKPNNVSVAYDFRKGEGGFYFLIYQVCYKDTVDQDDEFFDIHSRFELDFHFSNTDIFGRKSYLSSGEMNLPWLFFGFSIVYGICLYIWHSNIRLIKGGKQGYFDTGNTLTIAPPAIPGAATTHGSPTVYPIHYLMGVLLTLKFCSLLFESIQSHYLRVTGHAAFFSTVYYIFAFLKGMSLFTVVLLIGSGWSFVKPFLTEREKKMILGVLILQVMNNIAIVVLAQETEGEFWFDRWTAILHIVDILCCCAILMPIVWQVNQLEKNLEQNQHKEDNKGGDSGLDEGDSFINGNEDQFYDDDEIHENELDDVPISEDESSTVTIPNERMTAKLKLFRSFYLLVIAYIYMTRIVVYLFAATLNYKHTWITAFVVELTTLLFYTSVGYMFRPMNENPYLHIQNRKPDNGEVSQVELSKIDPRTKVALD